ncbi:protein YLS3-like [Prunus yedoensis var. nudiflora]|uniref:Protein YLS3-like n=1 Tax=Prunus yedoensis var. nudiflora TaxID=2094558 RepID=A0A314XT13_PRUYE|nr:protein YLS3-like [Prunus yedoensis var. nudiflora]
MRNKKLKVFCIVVASLAMASMATMEDDENECAEQMATLAACIPFVSGTAKKPTPECCENTKKVKATKPKCLCALIKESADPSMGLPVNTTLALQMPSACNIDGKISDCPSILKLPPNSPDAKIFKEADSNSTTSPTTDGHDHQSTPSSASTSSSSSVSTSPSSSSSGSDSKPSDSKANPSSGATLMKLTGTTYLLMMMVSMALMLN